MASSTPAGDTSDLGVRGAAAARWITASTLARTVLTFGLQVYFARLLGPDLYGVFATAALIVLVASIVVDAGYAWALLQAPELERASVQRALSWQFVAGLAVSAVLALGSTFFADLLKEPRAAPMLQAMAICIVMAGVTGSGQNLLLRGLRSRELALIQFFSYAVGFCGVSLLIAWMGGGVWSLVWGTVANSLLTGVLLMRAAPAGSMRFILARPADRVERETALDRTARVSLVTALTNWATGNVERTFIARLLGAMPLGNYTTANNLATVPTNLVLSAVSPIFLTLAGRMTSEPERIGGAFLRLLALIFAFVMPVFGAVSAVSNEAIHFLYGDRWLDAGPVLGVALLAAPWLVVFGVATPVLWNTGRQRVEFQLQWLLLPVQIAVLWLSVDHGLLGVAVAAAGLMILRAVVFMVMAARATRLKLIRIAARVSTGLALTLVAMGMSRLVARWADGMPDLVILALSVSAGSIAALSILMAFPRVLGQGDWALAGSVLPSPIRRALQWRVDRAFAAAAGISGGGVS